MKHTKSTKVEGIKVDGYGAKYNKALFSITKREDAESCVLEILDLNSGITFIIGMEREEYEQCFKPKQEKKYKKYKHNKNGEIPKDNLGNTGKQKYTKRNGSKFITYYGTSRNRECSDDAERND